MPAMTVHHHTSLAEKAMANGTAPTDKYFLSREHWSSVRLYAQHLFFTSTLGYVLHPQVAQQLPPDARICDVGTGTGVFLLDLANTLPDSATLDGFDVSGDQFPAQAWLPPNVRFSKLDILQPLNRPELRGQYDVVCLRMLVSVIPDAKAFAVVMENLIAMLKPGGYLQWCEMDVLHSTSSGSAAGVSTAAIQRLTDIMCGAMMAQADISWVTRMDSLFRAHNLAIASYARHPVRREMRSAWASNLLCAYDEVQSPAPDAAARDDTLRQLTAEAGIEARNGAGMKSDFWACVGRKQS